MVRHHLKVNMVMFQISPTILIQIVEALTVKWITSLQQKGLELQDLHIHMLELMEESTHIQKYQIKIKSLIIIIKTFH